MGDAEATPVLVSIVDACLEIRDASPLSLSQTPVDGKTLLAEDRRVRVDRTEERVPIRAQFLLEETSCQRFGIWLRLLAGGEMDVLQMPKNVAQVPVGVVDRAKRALDGVERVLRQVNHRGRVVVLEQSFDCIDCVLDAAGVLVRTAVVDESADLDSVVDRGLGDRRRRPETRPRAMGRLDGERDLCQGLLANLQSRGLRIDRSLLVILDGSKALRKAVRATFGDAALVQRCQVHKMRNILEYLNDRDRAWAQAILRRAYQAADLC